MRRFNAIFGLLLLFLLIRIAIRRAAVRNPNWPDVYYIILDGYGRGDILERDFGYNNEPFLNFLRARGFYVAAKSRSNYAYTFLSLASSLNMTYLAPWNDAPDQQSQCLRLIRKNAVMRLFQQQGYHVTRIDESDALIFRETILRTSAQMPSPHMIFAHLLCLSECPKSRYTDQLDYLSRQIEPVIDQLIHESKQPPIIVIQGDHGPACDGTSAHPTAQQVSQRMGILNAYYVPSAVRAQLYPAISPVNTWRLLLRMLFKQPLPFLPDKNYYSGPMDAMPYHFMDVTAS